MKIAVQLKKANKVYPPGNNELNFKKEQALVSFASSNNGLKGSFVDKTCGDSVVHETVSSLTFEHRNQTFSFSNKTINDY